LAEPARQAVVQAPWPLAQALPRQVQALLLQALVRAPLLGQELPPSALQGLTRLAPVAEHLLWPRRGELCR
jgi:hypothetical protein